MGTRYTASCWSCCTSFLSSMNFRSSWFRSQLNCSFCIPALAATAMVPEPVSRRDWTPLLLDPRSKKLRVGGDYDLSRLDSPVQSRQSDHKPNVKTGLPSFLDSLDDYRVLTHHSTKCVSYIQVFSFFALHYKHVCISSTDICFCAK